MGVGVTTTVGVGVGEGVGVTTTVGDGVGVGVGVTTTVGAGVGVTVGKTAGLTLVPLFHTRPFLPLMHLKLLFL